MNPENPGVHLGAAYMLNELAKKKEATGYYEKSVKQEPSLKNPDIEKTLRIKK